MVVLQPTSPLRKHVDINQTCNLIKKINAKVFLVFQSHLNIHMKAIDLKKGK